MIPHALKGGRPSRHLVTGRSLASAALVAATLFCPTLSRAQDSGVGDMERAKATLRDALQRRQQEQTKSEAPAQAPVAAESAPAAAPQATARAPAPVAASAKRVETAADEDSPSATRRARRIARHAVAESRPRASKAKHRRVAEETEAERPQRARAKTALREMPRRYRSASRRKPSDRVAADDDRSAATGSVRAAPAAIESGAPRPISLPAGLVRQTSLLPGNQQSAYLADLGWVKAAPEVLRTLQQPLTSAAQISPRIADACREAVEAVAKAQGATRVDTAVAGRLQRDRQGMVVPMEVRVLYAGPAGAEARQARISCEIDHNRGVVALGAL